MRLLLSSAALLFLAGCSTAPTEQTKKESAPKKEVEPVTGRKAFYLAYTKARMWSSDVVPLRVESLFVDSIPAKDGKYPAWRMTFASQSKGKIKVFTYSVVEASASLHEGVFNMGESAWSGPKPIEMPFYIQAFKIDSDEAMKVAVEKSAEYLKKNPNKPVFMQLEYTKLYPEAAWRVIWGDSVSTSDHSIYVSAISGNYLGKS